ncbi:MAG: glycerol kinase GlpK [Holophagales bacterium]|nr:glycerol kinase GlpK [Holophagales bacterium]MYG31768.1 glycerol kinase GlpK [Holophagales bacterium]MYI79610.1 glycerol kinase GlpK [Holophagales bacterium]
MNYILALDQGTTSSRSILFEHQGTAAASAQREFPQLYPSPGHVEHDPEAIWKTQLATARAAIREASASAADIAAIGIANQRETVVLWERDSGEPIDNAIVWQSRITAPLCERLKQQGHEDLFRKRTGLVLDPYFSGTKIAYLLDKHKLRARARRGEILAGTIDTFLLWRLTGGEVHATDASNASRTLLFDIHNLDWDDELLAILRVPRAMLPEVRDSSGDFGRTDRRLFGRRIPIAGIAGDQQAATFGQGCFRRGMVKNTYGTGCFILMNTGSRAVPSKNGLLTTVGWMRGGKPTYCLEGSVFVGGAAVQWLRDGLGLIDRSDQIEELAASEPDSGGVFLVPAFVGLGAPHWDPYARGLLIGLERSTTAGHVARATVESMAYQSLDVVGAMEADAGSRMRELRVDGGAAVNDTLMQFQADLLGKRVQRPVVAETTALGAAYLAGLAVGFWSDQADVTSNWALDREFEPRSTPAGRRRLAAGWQRAIERSRAWVEA